jgi:hypothetical protein
VTPLLVFVLLAVEVVLIVRQRHPRLSPVLATSAGLTLAGLAGFAVLGGYAASLVA